MIGVIHTQATARVREDIRAHLSGREYQIFLLLASGRGVIKIAASFNLAPSTVSTYRRRIFRKMGFRSIAELALTAQAAGLVRAHPPRFQQ